MTGVGSGRARLGTVAIDPPVIESMLEPIPNVPSDSLDGAMVLEIGGVVAVDSAGVEA